MISKKSVRIHPTAEVSAGAQIGEGTSICHGVTLGDGVFCGPHCVFTNDRRPRAINADGTLKATDDWRLSETLVKRGAAIGANAVIVCGIAIGAWAMIGAESVVTRDVPDYGLVCGNPARLMGFVCVCGERLKGDKVTGRQGEGETIVLRCEACRTEVEVDRADWESVG